jgi:hypothetical protein
VLRQKNKELGGYQVLEESEKIGILSARKMLRLDRRSACSPRQFLLDNSPGIHFTESDFQHQRPALWAAKDVLLLCIEDLQILRENTCLRIADAESPRRLLE